MLTIGGSVNVVLQKLVGQQIRNSFLAMCNSSPQFSCSEDLGSMCFILSVRFDFHMIDSLSIVVHAFVSRVSMSFSVDETLLNPKVWKYVEIKEIPPN